VLFFSYQRFAFLPPSVKIRLSSLGANIKLSSLGANIKAMPFKSEKQRRFLWSQHPDIAKRWAEEYPGQKNLPLYAHKKKPTDKEKAAAMKELNTLFNVNTVGLRVYNECVKKANSGLLQVEIPHSDKPVAAGDEHVTAENKGEDKASPVQTRDGDEVNQSSEDLAGDLVNNGAHPLLKKLAVVLSQPIMQAIENEKAEQEARIAAKMPQNAGIKRYAMPANTTPMPMGMQQPAQPAPTPAQQPAQPQQQGTGMNSPSANPINSFGALSTSGNINGNAAFGAKNSPDSSKSAGLLDFLKLPKLEKLETTGALPQDDKTYDWPRGQAFGKPYATAGGIPKDYKYLGTDHDGNPVLQGPDGKPVSMLHETGDLSRPSEIVNHAADAALLNEMFKNKQRSALVLSKQSAANTPCSCGCGSTVSTCKCGPDCSCRKQGGSCCKTEKTSASSPAWQRSAGKNDEGGLNAKGRASYNKATGGHLKAPVTEKNPTGEAKTRRHSFCSRMCGMKSVNTGAETAHDPDSRINKSLRKWNCKCSALMLAKTAGLLDFLKTTPKPADDWAPPATPKYDLQDENSDYDVYDKQYGKWEKDLRQYLKGKGYSQIKQHYYEPGGTPLSMRGQDGKYHEVWYPEENEPMHPPTALEDIYDSGDPNQVYRKGPGLMLVGPKQAKVVKSASQLYKAARPLGLDNYSSFAGPDQIQHAVQQYGQLKALVRPDDNTLRSKGLNRDGFQSALRHIVRNSQGQDKYNLSDMAPNPNLYAAGAGALGLLGTAGLGYLGGMDGAGVGLAGTGAGVAAAYMHAANKRQNILNTAKLMKEYGLLKPKTLAHAYPLLSDDHKFASVEEFVSKAAELAVARKS